MCLVVEKDRMIRRAETEIECWKVLIVLNDGRLYSPVMHSQYIVGNEKTIKADEDLTLNYFGESSIVRCGLHTYADYHESVSALVRKDSEPILCETKLVLVRCVIPVGAKYAEGTVGNIWGERGYVSDRLEIIEIVS